MTKSAKLQILFLVHVCLFVATGCTRESTSDSDVPPEHRNTFLLNAIVDHDLDTVRELLPESGVKPEDVNFETMYYYQEHGAEIPLTPLILAVIEADPRIVSYLITRGADVNLPLKESGATPVMFAATSDNEEALRILIDNGADIDYSAVHNTSVLQWAVRSDKPKNAEILITEGAQKETRDENGMTPLHHALQMNAEETIMSLLDDGADVNAEDKNGYTPLFYAVVRCDDTVVRKLLKLGADPLHTSNKGETLLHIDARDDWPHHTKLLTGLGISIDARNSNRQTALMVAAAHNNYGAAKMLIESGADISLTDNENRTAYDLSMEKGSDKLKNLLFVKQSLKPGESTEERAKLILQEGKDLYSAGKYLDAAAMFEKALLYDDFNGDVHYFLACTLAQIRKEGDTCRYKPNIQKQTLLRHLKKAVKIEPKLKDKLKSDPLFSELHDTFTWLCFWYSRYDPKEQREILIRTRLINNRIDTKGYYTQLTFDKDGTVILHREGDRSAVLMQGYYALGDFGISVQLDDYLVMPTFDHNGFLECGDIGTFTDETKYECR